jgi:itaconyl-CoA hydratase
MTNPDPDFSTFPVSEKGNKYEDFAVGDTLPHHWGRTLTAGDNAVFSTATCTWHPLYLNADFARQHEHPDLVVNPMLVLCTAIGLSVEDLSEAGGPFLGLNECSFHRPVYPGDTLVAQSTVLDRRQSSSHAGVGIVSWRTEAFNQDGELVVDLVRTNLVELRETA